MLNRVDASEDRVADPLNPLRVSGDMAVLLVCLLHRRAKLFELELNALGILIRGERRRRRHHLDQVGAHLRRCSRAALRTSLSPSASRYMPGYQRHPGVVMETIFPASSKRGPRTIPPRIASRSDISM